MEDSTPLAKLLDTLKTPSVSMTFINTYDITIQVYDSTEPETIVLDNIPPYYTIDDIQRLLWLQTDKRPSLFPKYTFFALEDEQDNSFTSALGYWLPEGVQDTTHYIRLPNPIEVIRETKIQEQFVDSDGEKRAIGQSSSRGRLTLEDVFLQDGLTELPIFHCFTFSYLKTLLIGGSITDNLVWYGLFYPFFPFLSKDDDGSITAEDEALGRDYEVFMKAKIEQFLNVQNLTEALEDAGNFVTTGVKFMNFKWKRSISNFDGVDVLFFSAKVNETRPFMRLLLANTPALTKLYQPNPTELPYVSDSKLLQGWIGEKSPIPEKNFLVSKITLQKKELGQQPIFGTLVTADDTTSIFTIQPPKGKRDLDFRIELQNLEETMIQMTEDLPIQVQDAELHRASLIVQLNLPKQTEKLGKQVILQRFSQLSTFFQPFKPILKDTQPFLSVRYKAVSNFMQNKEEFIFDFIRYQINENPDIENKDLLEMIVQQYELSAESAQKVLTDFYMDKEKATLVDASDSEFKTAKNPGIDVNIFADQQLLHNKLYFHINNISSTTDVTRLCTLFKIIFMTSQDTWNDIVEDNMDVTNEEAIVKSTQHILEEDAKEEKAQGAQGVNLGEIDIGDFDLDLNEENDSNKQVKVPEPVAAVPAPQLKKTMMANKSKDQAMTKEWVLDRLEALDKVLFKPTDDKGSPRMKEKPYSTQCQANWDKQPYGLTEDEYETIKRIYADRNVGFIEYGVPNTTETHKAAQSKKEKIHVLRYGSSPSNINYYMCAPIFCVRDLIPILQEDWDKKEECPFCHGKEIPNPSDPKPGQTVLKRRVKPPTAKGTQKYIGFLSKIYHPDGFALPCCFLTEEKLSNVAWQDRKFDHIRPKKQVKLEVDERDAEEEKSRRLRQALLAKAQEKVNFNLLLFQLSTSYISTAEKWPLDVGKFGITNVGIDKYFLQKSPDMISLAQHKLKPSANGFIRVGVLNTPSYNAQSLFSALAPILSLNSATEVAKRLLEVITPRVFINLNFGNLVLEFFNPKDPEPTDSELVSFMRPYCGITDPKMRFEMSRICRSYLNFSNYVNDPTKPKQLRHFIHALAEPGLLHPQGLHVIQLEYEDDPRNPTTDMIVKCPILGVDINRYSGNSVCFLTHYAPQNIWEPLMFVDSINTDEYPDVQEGYYSLTQEQLVDPTFPKIVGKRVVEFFTQCRSAYRGAYTYQSKVNNLALLPLTKVLELVPLDPSGIVRDSSNHLVALTFRKKSSTFVHEVMVPVIDDGNTALVRNTSITVHLGVQSVSLADANTVFELYDKIITPRLAKYSSLYTLSSFIKGEGKYIAYSLGEPGTISIILPCGSNQASPDAIGAVPIREIPDASTFEFEYQINREIFSSADLEPKYPESKQLVSRRDVDIIYEHLRLTFSNWIGSDEQSESGSRLRSSIEELINRGDLPSYEKMRRLKLQLGPTIQSWLLADDDPVQTESILLRKDCVQIADAESCSGICKLDGSTCKLHTPQQIQLSSTDESLDAVNFFITKLLDEIIRIPIKRYELMNKKVRKIEIPRRNIHVGNQWILPDTSLSWYDLLRGDNQKVLEQPMYYEEFSRDTQTNDELDTLQESNNLYALPDKLQDLLPAAGKEKLVLRVVGSLDEESKTTSILTYLNMEHLIDDLTSDDQFTPDELKEISKQYNVPVIQINISEEPPSIRGISHTILTLKGSAIVLVPDFESGPAIFTTVDQLQETIPSTLIEGPLFNSITVIKKPKLKPLTKK